MDNLVGDCYELNVNNNATLPFTDESYSCLAADVGSSVCIDHVEARNCYTKLNVDASDSSVASFSCVVSSSNSEIVTSDGCAVSYSSNNTCLQLVDDVVNDDYTQPIANNDTDATYTRLALGNNDYVSASQTIAEAGYRRMILGVTSDDYSHPFSDEVDVGEMDYNYKRLVADGGDVISSNYVRPTASSNVVSTTDTMYRSLATGDDVTSGDYSHPVTAGSTGVSESVDGYNCLVSYGDANNIQVMRFDVTQLSCTSAQQLLDQMQGTCAENAGDLSSRGLVRAFNCDCTLILTSSRDYEYVYCTLLKLG